MNIYNVISGVKTRRDRVPIGSVEPFTEKDYRPGGCTPLYDAMGKTLNELEGLIHPEDKVVVTVITDGMENSSQEYSGRIIKNSAGRPDAGSRPVQASIRTYTRDGRNFL